MLQGADSGFRYLSPHSVRRIIYEDLQPGNYRLVLQAAGNRSSWQGQPGILAFTVPIPWYFRPAGILPAVALLGLLFSGTLLYLRRVKHLRQINKYRTISLDPAQSTAILAKLNTIMDTEQLYLDPDLSIGQLADRMKLHSNYLSRTVNEHFGLGFNDYLNRLRIETVCARFRDPINRSKTILEIMYATGFNSKSVFNTAFKKFTGMTPTEFRRKLS
jgi:AraC-like DNA-binding protein